MLICLPGKPTRHAILLAATALGLALAAPAVRAQGDQDTRVYTTRNGEEVEVTAPSRHQRRSEIGAPIRDVAMTRQVRFDDLDLRTSRGAHRLEERIEFTARSMCRQLDAMYPVATEDSPPCYRTAVDGAMVQANAAISDAREVTDQD